MNDTTNLSDVQPKAVMTEDELKVWDALPASEQLKRLRAAIDKGTASGTSTRTVDEILQSVLARSPDASL
jgi:hypothetical protein